MRIVVIGLGSMGRRRIRLLKEYNPKFEIIGVDLSADRRRQTETELAVKTAADLEALLATSELDCAFICTTPLAHSKLITRCLEAGLNVFSEINLVADDYHKNIELAKQQNKLLFLSSTFLYRKEVDKIKELVSAHKQNLNYSYHIGQYLPDWHPWESYKDFFVSDKRSNSCREILAIELPWLQLVFGEIVDVVVKKSKNSNLEIDYADNYLLLVEHASGHKGMLAVDVISRKAVRNFELFGEELYVSWNGSVNGLKVLNLENKVEESIEFYKEVKQLPDYSDFIAENPYTEEIKAFFAVLSGAEQACYDFKDDIKILEWIDRIEA